MPAYAFLIPQLLSAGDPTLQYSKITKTQEGLDWGSARSTAGCGEEQETEPQVQYVQQFPKRLPMVFIVLTFVTLSIRLLLIRSCPKPSEPLSTKGLEAFSERVFDSEKLALLKARSQKLLGPVRGASRGSSRSTCLRRSGVLPTKLSVLPLLIRKNAGSAELARRLGNAFHSFSFSFPLPCSFLASRGRTDYLALLLRAS